MGVEARAGLSHFLGHIHQGNEMPSEDPSMLVLSIPYSVLIPSTDSDFALDLLLGPADQPHGTL